MRKSHYWIQILFLSIISFSVFATPLTVMVQAQETLDESRGFQVQDELGEEPTRFEEPEIVAPVQQANEPQPEVSIAKKEEPKPAKPPVNEYETDDSIMLGLMINGNSTYTTSDLVKTTTTNFSGHAISSLRFIHCTQFSDCSFDNEALWTSWENVSFTSFVVEKYDYVVGTYTTGEKKICVQGLTINETVSPIYCDTIIFDNVAPTGQIIIEPDGTVDGADSTIDPIVSVEIKEFDTTVFTSTPQQPRISVAEWLASNPSAKKVTICHIPPGNPGNVHTITISVNALKTHVDHHDDYIGECITEGSETIVPQVYYQTSNNGSSWTDWVLINDTTTLSDYDLGITFGIAQVFVRFKDDAGNISPVFSDTIQVVGDFDGDINTLPIYKAEYISVNPTTLPVNSYTFSTLPSELETNRNYSLVFDVKNLGSLVWYPVNEIGTPGISGSNPVNISYHWVNADTGQVYDWDGNRGFLTYTIEYNETHPYIFLSVTAPHIEGNFILQIDAVHEGVTWFSQQGNYMPQFNFFINDTTTEPTGELPPYEGDYGIGQPNDGSTTPQENGSTTRVCTITASSGVELYTTFTTSISTGIYVPQGVEVTILTSYFDANTQQLRVQIRLSDGRLFWIKNANDLNCGGTATDIPSYNIPTTTYEESHVCNARFMDIFVYPSWDSEVLMTVSIGYSLYKVDQRNDWIKVVTPYGQSGWIYKTFVCDGFDTTPTYNVYEELLFERPYDGSTIIITSDFGTREGEYHTGIDYGVSCGTELRAIADGTVIEIATNGVVAGNNSTELTPSNYIKILHTDGNYQSWYWHLDEVYVKVGDPVTQGQPIGTSGNTGYVRGDEDAPIEEQGCHLHFEIRSNDEALVDLTDYYALDPELLLQYGDLESEIIEFLYEEGNYGNVNIDELIPVYRLWRDATQSHLYTIDSAEKDRAISENWTYEGVAFYVKKYDVQSKTCPSGWSPVYRLWNPKLGRHFYTIDTWEATMVALGPDWDSEGIAFCAIQPNLTGGSPVYSFYSFPNQTHFYTIDESEKDGVVNNNPNWTLEGVRFKAIPTYVFAIIQKEKEIGNAVQDGVIHEWCGTFVQDYHTISNVGDSIIMYNPANQAAYLITGDIWQSYYSNGACDRFGLPTSNLIEAGQVSGFVQTFDNANIYWDIPNDRIGIVEGEIRNYFESKGGTWYGLGFPEGTQTSIQGVCGISGTYQKFNYGKIYTSPVGRADLRDAWLSHYESKHEMTGDYGWPKGPKLIENGEEKIYFQKGHMVGKWQFLHWYIEDNITIPDCPVCGNGNIETGEVCDDGNTSNGDFCSATCKNSCETPYIWDGMQCTPQDPKEFECKAKGMVKFTSSQGEVVCARLLDVPYFNQWLEPDGKTYDPTDGWMMCGGASATMIAGYYSKIPKAGYSSTIKDYMYKDEGTGLKFGTSINNLPISTCYDGAFGVTGMYTSCNQSSKGGIEEYFAYMGLETKDKWHSTFDNDITWNFVVNAIDKSHPLVITYGWEGSEFGHITVIKGYTDNNKFIMNDSFTDSSKHGISSGYNLDGQNALYSLWSGDWKPGYLLEVITK